MAKFYDNINANLQQFIANQHVFFVATAAADGRVNLSPKGMDSFRIIDNQTIVWLNLTGSGNETAAHLLKNPRMTIMFCSFEEKPLILRLYGKAIALHPRDQAFQNTIDLFPKMPGVRQLMKVTIESVQTSCGFAVPFMEFKEDRMQLNNWSEKKGEEQIKAYWESKNTKSIDGLATNILG